MGKCQDPSTELGVHIPSLATLLVLRKVKSRAGDQLLDTRAGYMLLKLSVESWLSWTDGKEACQRRGLGEEGKGSIGILAPDSKNGIQVPFIWVAVLTVLDTTPVISQKAGLTKAPRQGQGPVAPRCQIDIRQLP